MKSGILSPDEGFGNERRILEGVTDMFAPKGYYTSNGFVGFLPDGTRMMFPTRAEYVEYVEEADAA